jgi:hypothetical protein
MKNYIVLICLFAGLLSQFSCNTSSRKPNEEGSSPEGKMLKFKHFSYVDQQGAGMEAFSFLMPADWIFEGGIRWILDNPAMPSVTAFRLFNPEGDEVFEVFPNHCYFWTTNQGLLGMFPPGSKYFGSMVKQPVNAQNALRSIILREHRSGQQNLQIIKDEPQPELAKALTQGHVGEASGAKLRISYQENGILMEEEFYAVVEQITFPVQSMYGVFYNTIWYVDYIFSFKAKAGELESHTDVFQTITTSFKVNQKWYAKYNHMIEYMAQKEIRQIHSVGEFSRMLSRMSDQMSDEKMQQFEASNNVYDKVAENYSDHLRGVDKYYDPFEERHIDLPSGYSHAWCNNNGEYIVTDNPNLNPNVGSNLTWKPMDPK